MRLYIKYLSIYIKSMMEYKVSFLLTTIGQFLTTFTVFLGVYFMFDRFNSVNGFTFSEILLCFSIVLMAFSLSECFFRAFDLFSSVISNGEFDRMLVRPKNLIFQVLASKIEITRIGRLLQAIIMLIYAILTIDIVWSISKILIILFMIVGGTAMFAGLYIIYATICFFTIEGLEFMNIFTDGSREFGKYPMSIYGDGVLKFYTYVIPLACVQYYPLMYLLNKTDNIINMFTPIMGIVFLIPSLIFWKIGLKHYKSTGS
ncbi:ABC-2 family transporter protein [Sedimentibacter sp. zth1]|uniref:ABC transporter permease n=1 Tax=Sedimentibacter sp. zth1 TaxID=2816908 RepID=UPI001A924282|nr:ABC-2 family transporter protein [Sedimentibacter sp. zth1]QSX04700.1 ABC-2 family transporter protein [Sedimentibacter sp. zth1]